MGFYPVAVYYNKTQHTSHKITHHTQTKHSTQNYTTNKGQTTHNECNVNTITTTRMMELHLHSPVRLHGIVLKEILPLPISGAVATKYCKTACLRASPCLSVCKKHHEKHWLDFHEVWYRRVDTFQFWLKSSNNDGHFTWRPACISACVWSVTWLHIVQCFRFLLERQLVACPGIRDK
jgi:hypothetical protein